MQIEDKKFFFITEQQVVTLPEQYRHNLIEIRTTYTFKENNTLTIHINKDNLHPRADNAGLFIHTLNDEDLMVLKLTNIIRPLSLTLHLSNTDVVRINHDNHINFGDIKPHCTNIFIDTNTGILSYLTIDMEKDTVIEQTILEYLVCGK